MATDTLAEWLYARFFQSRADSDHFGLPWDDLPPETRDHMRHEADAVRRAVGRGGFKVSQGGVLPPAVVATASSPGPVSRPDSPRYGWRSAKDAPDREWDDA